MTEDVPLLAQIGLLILLLLISAFFSGSETALMSVNRYRLRHQAREGHAGARLAEQLLQKPQRLISLILLGSNIANTLATALVTLVALEIGGTGGVAVASVGMAFVIMVFTDVMPKTVGALRSEHIAPPAAFVYYVLLKVTLPVVWLVSVISSGLLRLMGLGPDSGTHQNLTLDELRTLVVDAGALLPRRRQRMLMAILELEDMTVDEIMIPDNELTGIDLEDDWDRICHVIENSPHTRLPVFRGNVDNLVGLLHIRRLVTTGPKLLDHARLEQLVEEPFFIPESASLHNLLLQFQRTEHRTAFVVDEYGDIQGMVTVEDILEEILGEFSGGGAEATADARRDDQSGAWVVNAAANVRALNRTMHWQLPTDGPTTVNGLILEQLGTIPPMGTVLDLNGYPVEVLETSGNAVRTVRVRPRTADPGNR